MWAASVAAGGIVENRREKKEPGLKKEGGNLLRGVPRAQDVHYTPLPGMQGVTEKSTRSLRRGGKTHRGRGVRPAAEAAGLANALDMGVVGRLRVGQHAAAGPAF